MASTSTRNRKVAFAITSAFLLVIAADESRADMPGRWREPPISSRDPSQDAPLAYNIDTGQAVPLSFPWNATDASAWLTFNGAAPASGYFCGNGCKPPGCPDDPFCACATHSYTCSSLQGVAGAPAALEQAEIRGWLTFAGFGESDSEWHFDILLDVGWTPTAVDAAHALNTIDSIARWARLRTSRTSGTARQTGLPLVSTAALRERSFHRRDPTDPHTAASALQSFMSRSTGGRGTGTAQIGPH